jgi:hypothetical protein
MESKKINQLATELTPALSDLTIIGDPTTGISKKITLSQMASLFTGTVEEYANLASFPLVGVADTIYIALDTNVLYRWDTGLTSYVELSPNIINSLVFSDANGFDGNISLVGSTATLTITTALTQGSVPFIGTSGALTQDNANLFFDDTNNRLGINTNSPTTALDVFGSGIIGRINGTSTNNAFLGFASAGTNKWSIGNVQSDHRFRIYNEATTSELVSVLQTGEFGIGIANPTTKIHIDGGASALIANLDANVSVAKSISFRSDNSNRINLEVSGTESGSDAGANLFIRRYSDAGALIDTPFTITRSTGAITLAGILNGTSAVFSSSISASDLFVGATATSANAKAYINATSGSSDFSNNATLFLNSGNADTTANLIRFNGALTKGLVFGRGFNVDNFVWGFTDSTTPVMTLTSAGNLAIGASTTSYKFEVSNSASGVTVGDFYVDTANNSVYVGRQSSTSGDNSKFYVRNRVNTLTALSVDPGGNGAVDVVGTFSTTRGTNLATATGNVLIGSTTDAGQKLQVYGDLYTEKSSGNASLLMKRVTNDTKFEVSVQESRTRIRTWSTANDRDLYFDSDNAGTTRMAITGGGIVLVNTTTATAGDVFMEIKGDDGHYNLRLSSNAMYAGAYRYLQFVAGGGGVGTITSNGSSTSYNTTSDYRLKEDLQEFKGLDKVLAIKTYDYKWKNSELRTDGVLAHELAEVLPYAVNGEKDGKEMQGVDYSKLVPVLVKAIQELNAEIEILKAK